MELLGGRRWQWLFGGGGAAVASGRNPLAEAAKDHALTIGRRLFRRVNVGHEGRLALVARGRGWPNRSREPPCFIWLAFRGPAFANRQRGAAAKQLGRFGGDLASWGEASRCAAGTARAIPYPYPYPLS